MFLIVTYHFDLLSFRLRTPCCWWLLSPPKKIIFLVLHFISSIFCMSPATTFRVKSSSCHSKYPLQFASKHVKYFLSFTFYLIGISCVFLLCVNGFNPAFSLPALHVLSSCRYLFYMWCKFLGFHHSKYIHGIFLMFTGNPTNYFLRSLIYSLSACCVPFHLKFEDKNQKLRQPR